MTDDESEKYSEIRLALQKKCKSLPLLTTAGEWRQSGWALSTDGGCKRLLEPLVSVPLYRFWTKIVEQRVNGWDGQSLYCETMFDSSKSGNDVAEHLMPQLIEHIEAIKKKGQP